MTYIGNNIETHSLHYNVRGNAIVGRDMHQHNHHHYEQQHEQLAIQCYQHSGNDADEARRYNATV